VVACSNPKRNSCCCRWSHDALPPILLVARGPIVLETLQVDVLFEEKWRDGSMNSGSKIHYSLNKALFGRFLAIGQRSRTVWIIVQ
jgi:hypothetical protein